MNTWSPPQTASTTVEGTASRRHFGNGELFAVAATIGMIVAFITSISVAATVAQFAADGCSPGEMWCGLGGAVAAIGIGLLAATVGYGAEP